MNIGIFNDRPTVDKLRDDVRDAADAGFSSYWTSQIFGLDTLTAFAVVASQVEGIRLGTGVVPTFPRHPMMLAQQALTVSQVSGGRLDLGIGLSHKMVVENMWGLSFDKPVRHMRDYLEILMPLLHDGSVSHDGESASCHGAVSVEASAPPVYVAALGEQMLRLAGRLADGTVTWMTGPRTIGDSTSPTIRSAAADAGRPDPQVIAAVPVCVTTDPDAARALAATQFEMYGVLPSYRAMLDHEGLGGPEDLAVVGSTDEVQAGLQRFLDAGADQVVANPFGSSQERSTTRQVLTGLLG